jgi:hypothetical protein
MPDVAARPSSRRRSVARQPATQLDHDVKVATAAEVFRVLRYRATRPA